MTVRQSEVIKTTSYDQLEIIKDIIDLHVHGGQIDCDPTYSKGKFYDNTLIKTPEHKFDIFPQVDGVIQSDCQNLPLDEDTIECLMFDPPFVASSGPSLKEGKSGSNIISKRFSCFPSIPKLWEFYTNSLVEFKRVIKPNGILIFKCQDTVSGGKQYFSHNYVMTEAIKLGFYPKDLFILLAKNRILSGKHKSQKHARKYHSYFWVFENRKSRVDYKILKNDT